MLDLLITSQGKLQWDAIFSLGKSQCSFSTNKGFY